MRRVVTGIEARFELVLEVRANSLPNCVVIRSIALQGSPTVLLRVLYFRKQGATGDLAFVKILLNYTPPRGNPCLIRFRRARSITPR